MESSNLVADKIEKLMSKTTKEADEKINNIKTSGRMSRTSSSSSASSNNSSQFKMGPNKAECVPVPTNTPTSVSESELSMLKTNNDRSSRSSRSGFSSIGASSIPFSNYATGNQLAEMPPTGLVFFSADGKYKMKVEMNEKKDMAKSRVPFSSIDHSQPKPKAVSLSGSVSSVLSTPAKSEEKVLLVTAKETGMDKSSRCSSKITVCNSTRIGTKISLVDGGRKHSLRLKAALVNDKLDTLVINGKNIKYRFVTSGYQQKLVEIVMSSRQIS